MDLLHGHLPWWNYYEGIGSPLVGEMQSAAFFPLTLLFGLSSGLLWFPRQPRVHCRCLDLLPRSPTLDAPCFFATIAGMLFAPERHLRVVRQRGAQPGGVSCPCLLLGIEMILDSFLEQLKARVGTSRPLRWRLSFYAGFPEVCVLRRTVLRGVGHCSAVLSPSTEPSASTPPARTRWCRWCHTRASGTRTVRRLPQSRLHRRATPVPLDGTVHLPTTRSADVFRPLRLRHHLFQRQREPDLGQHWRLLRRQRRRARGGGTLRSARCAHFASS